MFTVPLHTSTWYLDIVVFYVVTIAQARLPSSITKIMYETQHYDVLMLAHSYPEWNVAMLPFEQM